MTPHTYAMVDCEMASLQQSKCFTQSWVLLLQHTQVLQHGAHHQTHLRQLHIVLQLLGIHAGLACSTCWSSSRSASCSRGERRRDSSSYKPETDKADFTRLAGKSLAWLCHWQASIMAAKWPPAECPAT